MAVPYSDDSEAAGLVAKGAPGDNAAPLTITEISQRLKRVVEDQFGYVRLRGELSGVKRAASGHLYCCLKDDGARLDGVMWKGSVARLGFRPEDGVEVIATGKLTTYPGRSNYQIVIDRMEIAGEGALLALLAKTRARLAAEGLFDAAAKRAIPFLPRVIGVVTSPTGAVIRDILHRLEDRFPCHVIVWPVAVQGQGAAEQVAAAVRGFSALGAEGPVARPDVVIIARGGGSIEDLWCFNEEVVVRAIAACTIPVISAVGHETDTTLADFAADRRAPTPTAAAEMAVPVREELLAQLAELWLRKRRAVMRPVTLGRERLDARARRLPRPEALLAAPTQRLDDLGERARRGLSDCIGVARTRLQQAAGKLSAPLLAARLKNSAIKLDAVRLSPALLAKRIVLQRERVDGLEERARRGIGERVVRARTGLEHAAVRLKPALLTARIAAQTERLDALGRLMQSLNPDTILDKGFVRVTGPDGHTLMSRAQAADVPALSLHFRDGVLGVVPADARPAPPRPARKPAAPEQGKLL